MISQSKRLDLFLWASLLVTIGVIFGAFFLQQYNRRLGGKPLPVYGEIADFNLTNQLGQAVSLKDLRGKVWLADVIFTRCAGPCRQMTRNMHELQEQISARDLVRLISISTDSDYDKPPILKSHAEKYGVDFNRWWFLTGPKTEIARLAVGSLKLTALENTEGREYPEDLFIHSTIFVLVDRHARLRGWFETTGEGVDFSKVREQIINAIHRLERES
jgi:protein SCO1/2